MFLWNPNVRHHINYKEVKLSLLTPEEHTGGTEVRGRVQKFPA